MCVVYYQKKKVAPIFIFWVHSTPYDHACFLRKEMQLVYHSLDLESATPSYGQKDAVDVRLYPL